MHNPILPAVILFFSASALAQQQEDSAVYNSAIDRDLTIRKIAVLPATDNLNGIYARPLEKQISEILKGNHHYDLVETNLAGPVATPDELEDSPERTKKIAASIDSDALVVGKASKGPNGLTIKISMFLNKDGQLIAERTLRDHPRFEVPEVREQTSKLFGQILKKIPYDGLVLSRKGNRLTVNLGKRDGINKGRMLTVVQIIKVNRHPKFKFLINSEKEVLGKIKILKADNTLSFAQVITEKEKGAIQKYSKVTGLESVSYPEVDSIGGTQAGEGHLLQRPDSDISFGKNPQAWLPKKPPTFGKVGLKLSFGSYNGKMKLDGVAAPDDPSLSVKSMIYPALTLGGQIWINPNWMVEAFLRQGIISADNPLDGSQPSDLSHSLTSYGLLGGYNFLISRGFFGPKVTLLFGYSSYTMFVDDTAPQSITTMTYSGLDLGIRGSFPITNRRDWSLGAELHYFLGPQLEERPVTSGSKSRNSITNFALFSNKALSQNLQATITLAFELYSSTFSGEGSRSNGRATSASQRHTSLGGGIEYLF